MHYQLTHFKLIYIIVKNIYDFLTKKFFDTASKILEPPRNGLNQGQGVVGPENAEK